MIEKDKRIRLPTLLAAANGAPCMACGADDGTIVAAHGPKWLAGGGMGLKPDDYAVAYLCHTCHAIVDGRMLAHLPVDLDHMWIFAHMRTQRYWWKHRLVRVGNGEVEP